MMHSVIEPEPGEPLHSSQDEDSPPQSETNPNPNINSSQNPSQTNKPQPQPLPQPPSHNISKSSDQNAQNEQNEQIKVEDLSLRDTRGVGNAFASSSKSVTYKGLTNGSGKDTTGRSSGLLRGLEGDYVETEAGRVEFSAREREVYLRLFRILDVQGCSSIAARIALPLKKVCLETGSLFRAKIWHLIRFKKMRVNYNLGNVAAVFMKRSGLDQKSLQVVWRLACGGQSKPRLSQDEFLIAMKLVSLAQNEKDVDLSVASAVSKAALSLPVADFKLLSMSLPDFSASTGEEFPKSTSNVRVEEPQIVGTGFARHVEYTVTVASSLSHMIVERSSVRRRYSDFLWLHKFLQRKLPGTILPPIPSKVYVGNFDPKFLEERRVALEHYLDHLIRHPRLSKSFELHAILAYRSSSLDDLKHLSKLAEPTSPGTRSGSRASKSGGIFVSFLEKAYAFVGHRSPSNASIPLAQRRLRGEESGLGIARTEIDGFRTNLRRYCTGLNEVVRALKLHIEHRRAKGYNLARLGFYLQRLGELEEMFIGDEDSVSDWAWMRANGERLERIANTEQDLNKTLTNDVLAALQYQQGMVKQAEKLLSTHEKQFTLLQNSHEDLANMQMRHAAARANGSAKAENDAREAIREIKVQIDRTENALRQLNSTIASEMQRFNEQKLSQLADVASVLVRTEQRRCLTQVETLLQFTNA